ncbi:SLC13 family permease [Bombilactobacillus bombi]|uniref:SLC13 family permease n=1 Tax=Bombilactobacillus bombi TaxID=1303590 RepID=UPI002175136E|nr:SLC13 family permease [Bombilactobacillus bombi]
MFKFVLAALSCLFFVIPPFPGLTRPAMNYLGVFLLIIIFMMIHIVADYVVIILGLMLMVVVGVGSFREVFSLFGDTSFWNLIGIFGFSAGVINSGLLNRLTNKLFSIFPDTIVGQVTAIFISGLILSPLIPSVTAKMTLLASFAVVIAQQHGYAKSSKEAVALYIAMYLSGYVFGIAFSTGGTSAAIIVGMLEKQKLNFGSYLANSFVWLLLVALVFYLILLQMFKGDKNHQPQKTTTTTTKTEPMSKNEKFTMWVLIIALFFWIFGPIFNVPSYLVGVVALCAFLTQGTLSTKEFKSKISWDMVILITGFMETAQLLTDLHIDTWLANKMAPILGPVVNNIYIFIPVLCLLVVLVRTFVVSEVACMSIFYALFAESCAEVGINAFIILFITLVISQTWHTSYNQMGFDAAQAATDRSLVEYQDIQKFSWMYIVVCMVIFELSVPLWHLTGMIK